jgi:hypothetical protein
MNDRDQTETIEYDLGASASSHTRSIRLV